LIRRLKTGIVILLIAASALSAQEVQRPRIGLVLSGGGARGFAHIGVLKMLDSLEIPIDVIAGTSMGGIVGALYSIGHSGMEVEVLSNRTDWQEIFTDTPPRSRLPYFQKRETGRYQMVFGVKGMKPATPSGLIFGQKVHLLFSSLTFPYEQVTSFDELPCPFRCVAVDLVTGNQVVMDRGSLARAMRSTMAIPTIFSPVEWGDSLLIDGGILNNLPVDVVRAMGADIVIAVDVGLPLMEKKELNTVLDILDQSIAILGREQWRRNVQDADILITPDLTGFTMQDFNNEKIKKIIRQGDLAARQYADTLLQLKETYQLQCLENPTFLQYTDQRPQIHDIQITGHTTLNFQYVYEKIGLYPGDFFDPMCLYRRISELKAQRIFEDIQYEVIPVSESLIRLLIRVQEIEKPVIHGLHIEGLKNIRFSTVYRLLGIKPGDRLDTELLNKRIMNVYALGYFEHITYRIKSTRGNRVFLTISIKELPFKQLRIGLRYDNYHKLVVAASMLVSSPLIRGLRVENEIQFSGLTKVHTKVFYPSKTLSLPAYPFFRFTYRNVPMLIFDDFGSEIAEYEDRAYTTGIGIGLLDARLFNMEVEYLHENTDIAPRIAMPVPELFPSWNHHLRSLQVTATLDALDDALLPGQGCYIQAFYEGSYRQWNSDLHFQRLQLSVDVYHTWDERHTMRYFFFGCGSSSGTPIYKFFNPGRPQTFVGMEYDQLFGSSMTILRLEYRYAFSQAIYFNCISNIALEYHYHVHDMSSYVKRFWGAGAGIKYYFAPLGTIEFIYSRGSESIYNPTRFRSVIYFSLGTKF